MSNDVSRPLPPPRGLSGVALGRLFGVEIRIDWSLALIFALILADLGVSVLPAWHPGWSWPVLWGTALAASVLFFVSVLAHEMSHALVGRAQGIPIRRITLFLFGGMAHLEREPESPKAELLMASVGPFASLVIGAVATFAGLTLANAASAGAIEDPAALMASLDPFTTLLLWLGPINLALGIFNLVPGFPLDGGRVLRAILWSAMDDIERATRWASRAGQLFAAALMALGAVSLLGGQIGPGIWWLLIGWFLHRAARASYEQLVLRKHLADVPLASIMRDDLEAVDGDMSIQDLIVEHVMRTDSGAFLVADGDELLGEVTMAHVRRVARGEWSTTRVRDVMTPADELPTLSPDDGADRALEALGRQGVGQVTVREDGDLVGVVRQQDIMRWLVLSPPTA